MITRVSKWKRPRRSVFLVAATVASLLVASVAFALISDSGTYDITVDDTSGTGFADLGNATVTYIGSDSDNSSSGTGLFDPFVRLQGSPTEEGYNTCSQKSCGGDVSEFETKVGTWTKAILASAIPTVDCDGDETTEGDCWELFVDINEGNNATYISLNEVEVWLTTNPDITDYDTVGETGFTGQTGTTPVYDFTGDILINDVNQGSGRGDLIYLIPVQPFTPDDYFVLYSEWGTTTDTDDDEVTDSPDRNGWGSEGGFEEWKVRKDANVSIVKTADAISVNAGQDIGFTITVSNTGAAAASNVTISDPLPAGGDWSLDPAFAGCEITGSVGAQTLECSFSSLASGGTIGPIHITSPTTATDCGVVDNTATVSLDGTAVDDDDATVTIQCGALQITKTAKHADTSGDTSANLVATFSITDAGGNLHSITTDATGVGCVGGVTIGLTQSITETAPAGYAAPTIANVTVASGSCSGTTLTGGTSIGVENTPLTDVDIVVDSQHDGATSTLIECWGPDSDPVTDPADYSATVSDGTLSITDLDPTDPAITLNCQITVDP